MLIKLQLFLEIGKIWLNSKKLKKGPLKCCIKKISS
jgi:hypothetical protein